MLANASGNFDIVIIQNPFDPSERKSFAAPVEGKSIQQLMSRAGTDYVVSLNGGIIPEDSYNCTYPISGDSMVVMPIPRGGGDGAKSVLRVAAIIALTYVSGGIAAGTIGGLTAGSAGAIAAATAVTIGGTMLINAVLPPPRQLAEEKAKNKSSSSTYGIDGAKNTSSEGVPVPICYGRHRMAGNIIAMHSENIDQVQYLHMLLNAGEGEIDGIEDIKINDQKIEVFKDTETQVRTGTASQPAMPWFNKIIKPINVGLEIKKDEITRETEIEVDQIRFDITFPRGIFKLNNKGKREDHHIELTFTVASLDSSYSRTIKRVFTSNKNSALRYSILIPDLPEARYRTTVIQSGTPSDSEKKTYGEPHLTDINQIILESVTYKHTALLGLKLKITDQLRGVPKVTYINKGVKVKTWDESQKKWVLKASSNPAWIVYDMLTNVRYGGAIAETQVDIRAFRKWAKFCDERKLEFNAVIDSIDSLWDALQLALRIGHANVVMAGTRYSLSIEMPANPVMMFSQANIIQDSFSINWLPSNELANEVEVSYFDEAKNFEKTSIKLYDDKAAAAGELQRLNSFTLVGVTKAEQAHYEAVLALNMNRYVRQTVTFDAYVDAIACTIGSVIYVQHDMPKWGLAGRIKPGSTRTELIIDEDLEESTKVLIKHSAVQRQSCLVSRVIGDIVYLDDFNADLGRVKRLQLEGKDYPIIDVTNNGVILDSDTSAIQAGHRVTLWDTDVLEERDLLASQNEGRYVLAQPLSQDPAPWSDFMAGTPGRFKKPFRVKDISGTGQMVRTITAIEYNESVFNRDLKFVETPNNSLLTDLTHSVILGIEEQLVRIASSGDTLLTLNFYNNHSAYMESIVQVSYDGGKSFSDIGRGASAVKFNGTTDQEMTLRVVAVDLFGRATDAATAPTLDYKVLGLKAPPSNVTGLRYKMVRGGIEISWDKSEDLDIRGYEIRRGVFWDTALNVNELVQTTTLFYPISEASRETFLIRAVDSSNNLSETPAVLEVVITNPPKVTGFAAVRNGDQINLVWDTLKDPTVMDYEIREGYSWPESTLVTQVDGNNFALPSLVAGSRTFWIKARNFASLYSEVGLASQVSAHIEKYRNIVLTQNHRQMAWPAKLNNLKKSADNSQVSMIDDVNYAEYLPELHLAEEITSHNSIELAVSAILPTVERFEDMDFTFEDPKANRPFVYIGDIDKIESDLAITRPLTGAEGLFQIKLDGSLKDKHSSAKIEATPTSYADSRFHKGLNLTPFSKAELKSTTVPAYHLIKAWHRITESDLEGFGSLRFWTVKFETGNLEITYNRPARKFYARWPDGLVGECDLQLRPKDDVMLLINQATGKRRFMVGKPGGEFATSEVKGEPLGPAQAFMLAR